MQQLNQILRVRLRTEDYDALKAIADEDDIYISTLARTILKNYLRFTEEDALDLDSD